MRTKYLAIVLGITLGILIALFPLHAVLANQNNNQCNSNNPDNCPSPTAICDNGEHTGNPHCHTPSPTPTSTPEEDNDCLYPGQVDTDRSTDDHPCFSPTPTPCVDNENSLIWEPCDTSTPTASPSATPIQSPSPTPIDTNSPTSTPSGDMSTSSPQVAPNAGEASSDASCTTPSWIPVVTYLGQSGNTFTYSWTYPDTSIDTFWINYGYTPQSLIYSEIVTGNKTSITMDHQGVNFVQIAAYSNGCTGPFSNVIN